jgi:SNF2 family DNA or RNA helicase
MIVVSGAGDKLLVTLSADEPSEVRETIESLMGCRYNPKTNVYFVPVHDFPLLREKIQRLGHSGQREMDEEAWRLIRDYEERLRLNDVIRDGALNDEIAREIDETLKSAPWQDQRSDVRFCLRHQRAGIFHEMGVGKTLVLLATFAVLRRRGLARYGLVVCPNTVKATWLRQTAQHTRLTAQEIGNGSAEIARRLQRLQDDRPDLTVTHYEALRDPQVQRALVKMPFDVVIADEVHLIKNIQTDRAQAMFATLAQIRPAVSLVEVEVELPDGTTTTAVMPAGVQPGQEIDFL